MEPGSTSGASSSFSAVRPSSALSTEMAGVIMASAQSSEKPARPRPISTERRRRTPCPLLRHERHQRQLAALAAVVGPHDDAEVLDGDHDDEGPEHQRQHAEDVVRARRQPVLADEALAQGVDRTRADVAVDHAEGGQGEYRRGAGMRGRFRRGRRRIPDRLAQPPIPQTCDRTWTPRRRPSSLGMPAPPPCARTPGPRAADHSVRFAGVASPRQTVAGAGGR